MLGNLNRILGNKSLRKNAVSWKKTEENYEVGRSEGTDENRFMEKVQDRGQGILVIELLFVQHGCTTHTHIITYLSSKVVMCMWTKFLTRVLISVE